MRKIDDKLKEYGKNLYFNLLATEARSYNWLYIAVEETLRRILPRNLMNV